MNKSSNELIHRYLMGNIADDEVHELESRLLAEAACQDEFLFQAEVDAHLRQTTQSVMNPALAVDATVSQSSTALWKWISGVTTVAAAILVAIVLFSIPPERAALAHPSLGELMVNIQHFEQDIWSAASENDLVAIRRELANSVSPDVKSECGLTPLHIATLANHPLAIEVLLAHGADVSLTDREGNTALHMASFLGRTQVVRLLLKAGSDPARRNHLGFSSMDNVAISWSEGLEGYYHQVECVLKTKLDLKRIRAERPIVLRLLASKGTISPDVIPSVSIWRAAMTGNSAAVEQHTQTGTNINTKEDLSGSTPLIVAATFGQVEVAKILIKAGADLNARNNSGGTALHVACFYCQPEMVELLLNEGADPELHNNWQLTPLEVATCEFNAELEEVYRHAYGSLNLQFNLQHVQQLRVRIAEIFKNFSEDR